MRLEAIQSGEDRRAAARLARLGLSLAACPYGLATSVRNRLFDLGLRRVADLGRPVVSVGNLTTGGTGKTPMVIEFCRRLQAMGERPAVLLRGYKGAADADDPQRIISDEVGVYESELGPDVVVEANPDRRVGATRALAADAAITCFVLDDGFQHRQAGRDLDIVLIDATSPFGHGHLLPRGLMRETMSGLRRADAIIVTRCDADRMLPFEVTSSYIHAVAGQSPTAFSQMRWSALIDQTGAAHGLDDVTIARPFVVSGVGNPDSFLQMATRQFGVVAGERRFADHHDYVADDLAAVASDAKAAGADALLITEKDWVKWSPLLERGVAVDLPIFRPRLAVAFLHGGEAIDGLLKQLTERR